MPLPIRDQARVWVVGAFQNDRLGFDVRLQAAIALLLEGSGLGPAPGRPARELARLEGMKVVETTTGPPSSRECLGATGPTGGHPTDPA